VDEAQEVWELKNRVEQLDGSDDWRYKYDEAEQKWFADKRPWTGDPHYFRRVHISAVALIKMVMHARSGGNIEVMGSMQGKVDHNEFVVTDAFPLPVEGTETRVSAHAEGNEFLVAYHERSQEVGRKENIIGWYHSHPSYGCWLSGIDVQTQQSNQQYQDPFLAVVIDPIRTMSTGKVEIGAFRTYPIGYKDPDEGQSEYQTIPLSKIEDFGVHCKSYYPLEVTCFKSTMDSKLLHQLWRRYWASTLSSSPLLENRDYLASKLDDIAAKAGQAHEDIQEHTRAHHRVDPNRKLLTLSKDVEKIGHEHLQGIMTQAIRRALFRSA